MLFSVSLIWFHDPEHMVELMQVVPVGRYRTWQEELGVICFSLLSPLLKRTRRGETFSSSSSSLPPWSSICSKSSLFVVLPLPPPFQPPRVLVTSARIPPPSATASSGGRRAVLIVLILIGLTPQSCLNSSFRWRIFSASSCGKINQYRYRYRTVPTRI